MSVKLASLILLKLKINNQYINIGGVRMVNFSINNQLINNSNIVTGKFQSLLPKAGIVSVNIEANGLFVDSEAEQLMMQIALENKQADLLLCFANGDELHGGFLINNLERGGDFEDTENYHLSLVSCNQVNYNRR